MNKWQPIVTAPTDGSGILVCGGRVDSDLGGHETDLSVMVCAAVEDYGGIKWAMCNTCYYSVWMVKPTHWMPLPFPPETE